MYWEKNIDVFKVVFLILGLVRLNFFNVFEKKYVEFFFFDFFIKDIY